MVAISTFYATRDSEDFPGGKFLASVYFWSASWEVGKKFCIEDS